MLNGVVPVAGPTRERVQAAIDELGYVPNLAARGLRSGRTGIVALVMPELRTPFSAELSHEFVQLAHDRGLGVQIEETWGDPGRSRELLAQARRHHVDGVVLNPITIEEGELALSDGTTDVPIVLLGEVLREDVDQVWVDSVAAAASMTSTLVGLGYRRIAFIGGPRPSGGTETERLRRDGYRLALTAAGLPLDARLERPCGWDPAGGALAVRAMLDDGLRPDAIFCSTDSIAIGVLSELWRVGLRVPEDVAVAGFDDVADGEYAVPPLTTVHFDKRQYAATALDRLEARIAGSTAPAVRVAIPVEIVERASTRPRTAVPTFEDPQATFRF